MFHKKAMKRFGGKPTCKTCPYWCDRGMTDQGYEPRIVHHIGECRGTLDRTREIFAAEDTCANHPLMPQYVKIIRKAYGR